MANRAATVVAFRAPRPAREPDDLVLVRAGLRREPLGGRTWRGALANRGDAVCTDVAIEIRFLDCAGGVVGGLSRHAARLAPGSELDLQSRLPPQAVAIRIEALRWTIGGECVEDGPGAPRPFGDGEP